jgi:small multidrug resistance pump
MMGYLFLALAIIGEVIATTFLKFTTGERAVWWAYPIVGVGYVFAFSMLSLTLSRGVPLGIAYALWAGIGVVLVAIVSWLAFHETLTWVQLAGMGLVIAGVVLLELGGRHDAATH